MKSVKTNMLIALGVSLASAVVAAPVTQLNSESDKLSYTIGVDLGKNLQRQGITINPTVMAKGLEDGLAPKAQFLLTDAQMKDVLVAFQHKLLEKQADLISKKAKENKIQGDTFMSQNKSKADVVTLPSGLQYKILQKGDGVKPTAEDTVTVEYTGRLIDGQVFDSTSKSGKPATFKVSQVIPGWTEALQLMPVGATWEVYVPAALAYGSRTVGGAIGPNQTLIFNIHLLGIEKEAKKS